VKQALLSEAKSPKTDRKGEGKTGGKPSKHRKGPPKASARSSSSKSRAKS
jgi:hypothetical protein